MGKLIIAHRKRASFDYEIFDKYEAGIVLYGSEVKSIRSNSASINEAFVIVKNLELFILNMNIATYKFATNKYSELDPTRTRKLLLHKNEIKKIFKKIKLEKLTLIPTSIYFVNGRVKMEIALGKGKKNYDKRETIKKRDVERRLQKIK
ncbi:SsrA-binding protein SmpB [Spiroplasma endosymbiont of Aspidapion aeneum]|uniref:SsrA-binding protein SmpB n=1 Tax=Spiroplasma endosymbiont of Aspidapion aeneum TaxID=3066276 RepID=UPI00313E383A